jgi:hypothetical protein
MEEAVAGARALGFKVFEMAALLSCSRDDLCERTRGGCLIFVSMDALPSCYTVFTLGSACILVVDEAHMVQMDMCYRYAFRSAWELGVRVLHFAAVIIMTATLRPCFENDVIYDLGLEEAASLHVLRASSNRGYQVQVCQMNSAIPGPLINHL